MVGKNIEEVIYNKQQRQFVRAVREGSKAKLIHFKDAQLFFSRVIIPTSQQGTAYGFGTNYGKSLCQRSEWQPYGSHQCRCCKPKPKDWKEGGRKLPYPLVVELSTLALEGTNNSPYRGTIHCLESYPVTNVYCITGNAISWLLQLHDVRKLVLPVACCCGLAVLPEAPTLP